MSLMESGEPERHGSAHCEAARERLDAYHDGEVASDEASDVDLHLADCDACRAELARVRESADELRSAFHGVLRGAPPAPPAPQRRPRAAAAIVSHEVGRLDPWLVSGEPLPARHTRRTLAWILAGAAAVVALVVLEKGRTPATPQHRLVADAARRALGTDDLRLTTTGPEHAVELRFETSTGRFGWQSRAATAGAELLCAGGQGDGDLWLLVPGEGVYREEHANERWLPDASDASWPPLFGPRAVELLRELADGRGTVTSIDVEPGALCIALEAPAGSPWSSAVVRLVGDAAERRIERIDARVAGSQVALTLGGATDAPGPSFTYAPLADATTPVRAADAPVPDVTSRLDGSVVRDVSARTEALLDDLGYVRDLGYNEQ
jgi:hypothetical protein